MKKWLYPGYLWSMPRQQKKIYLSFDDGPHPVATEFVLDELKKYNAKATFFCIGKNVAAHPGTYKRILSEGHATGNHTHDHVNGWKTNTDLFRPPYGRITRFQARQAAEKLGFTIVMWSVLSGDFDTTITPQKCWGNVKRTAGNGSIIVFHDSEKAMERMTYALTEALEYFSKKGFVFEKLGQ